MRLSTTSLATASASHPWRAVRAWLAVTVLAVVAIMLFLSLTSRHWLLEPLIIRLR